MTRRRFGLKIMAAFFVFLALSAFREGIPPLLGSDANPVSLGVLQTTVGLTAALAAVGSWRAARWSPWAAIAYGVIAGAMVASLGAILDLPGDARPGLLGGGAAILVIGLACAWYLRRATTRPGATPR